MLTSSQTVRGSIQPSFNYFSFISSKNKCFFPVDISNLQTLDEGLPNLSKTRIQNKIKRATNKMSQKVEMPTIILLKNRRYISTARSMSCL